MQVDAPVFNGQKMKKLRLERGLTQTELAEKVGLKLLAIHNYEAGKRFPTANTLSLLVVALSSNSGYLLDEFDYDGPLSDDEARALRDLHQLGRPATEADVVLAALRQRRKK